MHKDTRLTPALISEHPVPNASTGWKERTPGWTSTPPGSVPLLPHQPCDFFMWMCYLNDRHRDSNKIQLGEAISRTQRKATLTTLIMTTAWLWGLILFLTLNAWHVWSHAASCDPGRQGPCWHHFRDKKQAPAKFLQPQGPPLCLWTLPTTPHCLSLGSNSPFPPSPSQCVTPCTLAPAYDPLYSNTTSWNYNVVLKFDRRETSARKEQPLETAV